MRKNVPWLILGFLLVVISIYMSSREVRYCLSPESRGQCVDPYTGKRYEKPWFMRIGEPRPEPADISAILALPEPRVLLLDVSKWQGEWNAEIAKEAGASGVIIRASYSAYGKLYVDPSWAMNALRANAAGLPCGLYHYATPNVNAYASARFFIEQIKLSPCRMAFVLDLEDTGGLAPNVLAVWVKIFLDEVEKATGQVPWIYTRALWFNLYVSNWDSWDYYQLWIAMYSSTATEPWPPYETCCWDTWELWQWTSTLSGPRFGASSTYIDGNWYNGTVEEFQEKYGPRPEYRLYFPVMLSTEQ